MYVCVTNIYWSIKVLNGKGLRQAGQKIFFYKFNIGEIQHNIGKHDRHKFILNIIIENVSGERKSGEKVSLRSFTHTQRIS